MTEAEPSIAGRGVARDDPLSDPNLPPIDIPPPEPPERRAPGIPGIPEPEPVEIPEPAPA
jgi:hypothetical protein